ncbi:MAG: hypothetical protein PHW13_00610 [Methylococcales bacterium]|nr:hypothetical protein [Methylococcales bacterium]
MAINKDEFLSFAKNLPAYNEINNRNAISRAYYAAYHHCSEKFLANKNISGGVHSQLIDSLVKSPSSTDRQIGYMLKNLKDRRTTADYFLNDEVTFDDRQKTIKSTEMLIALGACPRIEAVARESHFELNFLGI